jgi:tetratricopeptide (TPR) repeat protein
MTIEELNHYIAHPQYLNKSTLPDLRQLVEMYPYCATFSLLYAKNLSNINDIQFGAYLQKAAMQAYHRDALQQLIAIPAATEPAPADPEPVKSLSKPSAESKTVPELVESLSKPSAESSLLELSRGEAKDIQGPSFDLIQDEAKDIQGAEEETAIPERSETYKPFKQQDLIDKFIATNPKIQFNNKFEYEDPTGSWQETESETIFTESLAKIYIKQGQYAKALQIFEKLNLKYPEKSTYFADQIRFLKKIIQNS